MNFKQYRRILARKQLDHNNLKRDYDVVLPPEDQVPLPTIMGAKDNWAGLYLKIWDNIDTILEAAKQSGKKACIIIHDTAGEYHLDEIAYASLSGWNYSTSGDRDGNNHSTACAGIIVGKHNTRKIGLLTKLAEHGLVKVVPSKVLNDNGSGQYGWIAGGLNRSANLDLGDEYFYVDSLSLGGTGHNKDVTNAINRCIAKGHFVSASAGNDGLDPSGKSTVRFPANYEPVLAWAAVHQAADDVLRAPYSSVGMEVDFTAPSSLTTFNKDGELGLFNGTSFSNPAGVAVMVILKFLFPQIKEQHHMYFALDQYITDLGMDKFDLEYGNGIPVIVPYINSELPKLPDQPQYDKKPPKEKPIRKKPDVRVLTFPIPSMEWKYTEKVVRNGIVTRLYADKMNIEVTTDAYAEDLYPRILEWMKAYYERWTMALPSQFDLEDAVRFMAWVAEMHLNRDKRIQAKVTLIEGGTTDAKVAYKPTKHYVVRSRSLNHRENSEDELPEDFKIYSDIEWYPQDSVLVPFKYPIY